MTLTYTVLISLNLLFLGAIMVLSESIKAFAFLKSKNGKTQH